MRHLIHEILKYAKSFIFKPKFKVKGKGNQIIYKKAEVRNTTFEIIGDKNTIEIQGSSYLKDMKFFIRGNSHSILISEGCQFNSGGTICLEDYEGSLEIGSDTTFENIHIAITEPQSSMRIGSDCMFAYDIDIRTGDSHSIIDAPTNARLNLARNVLIGNHVWVAAHCVILKDSVISDHAVVATGSIVTKQFNQGEVVIAGNPAKIVKEGISWTRERIY